MRYPKAQGKEWFVYLMRCLLEDVGNYVGITTRPFEREKEHKGKKKGYKLAAAIHLYGEENFTYEIIDRCGSEKAARALERMYIKEFNAAWPHGLNVAAAGKGSLKYQYDTRRKAQIAAWEDEGRRKRHSEKLLRAMNTTTARQRNSEAAKRRWADPAYQDKQRKTHSGKTHDEATKRLLREQKLAASAAKGGPKDRRKYKGASLAEANKLNAVRLEVRAKRRATWEENREKNVAAIRASNAIHNSDPEAIANRSSGKREAAKKNPRKASDETRAKLSSIHKERWTRIKALQNPEGNA